jgi:hypothetical protein
LGHSIRLTFFTIFIDLYERSIRQVPNVVKLIQDKGFKLMTVSECIGDSQAHSSPKSPVSSKVSDSKQNSDTTEKSQPIEKKQSSSNKVLATATVSIAFAAISLAHYLL